MNKFPWKRCYWDSLTTLFIWLESIVLRNNFEWYVPHSLLSQTSNDNGRTFFLIHRSARQRHGISNNPGCCAPQYLHSSSRRKKQTPGTGERVQKQHPSCRSTSNSWRQQSCPSSGRGSRLEQISARQQRHRPQPQQSSSSIAAWLPFGWTTLRKRRFDPKRLNNVRNGRIIQSCIAIIT